MERLSASPLMMAVPSQLRIGRSRPSTSTWAGRRGSALTAAASAHSEALRMSSRSMRSGGASATPTSAVASSAS